MTYTLKETICPAQVYEKRENTEYGTVVHLSYESKATGLNRGVSVLLPAGYSEDKKYSVIYFQHGIFGDEYTMLGDENYHVKEILGNLIADGNVRESIVVFPDMFAKKNPEDKPAFNQKMLLNYDYFIYDLVGDLIPFIESTYSVYTDKAHRAILGFSMGGRETLYIGTRRPDLFSAIGAISPAPGLTPGEDWALKHPGMLPEDQLVFADVDERSEILMVCCGTDDKVVGKFPASYHAIFEKNGVEHLWYEVPGADHDDKAIRSGFYNFLLLWK